MLIMLTTSLTRILHIHSDYLSGMETEFELYPIHVIMQIEKGFNVTDSYLAITFRLYF